MVRVLALVVGCLVLSACMTHERLSVTSLTGRRCIQTCRASYGNDDARLGCAAACDSAIVEDGTCSDRNLAADACVDRSHVRAGRLLVFVALTAIVLVIGISISAGPQT